MSDEQTEAPDFELLWRNAIEAVRILGREVRALRAEVARLSERLAGEAS